MTRRRQWRRRSIDVWLQLGDRPSDRPTGDGQASRRLEATRRCVGRPARLILNIDHVYSTQRDSLVITISTTGQHGPLASSIVPADRGSTAPPLPVPSSSARSHCIARWFVCNFIKWVSLVRWRRVEFDESLKLTVARAAACFVVVRLNSIADNHCFALHPTLCLSVCPAALALITATTDNWTVFFL